MLMTDDEFDLRLRQAIKPMVTEIIPLSVVQQADRSTWRRPAFGAAMPAALAFVIVVALVGGVALLRVSAPIGPGPSSSLLIGAAVGPSASAVQSASGQIAFVTSTPGVGPQLWLANADGTGKHEVASDLGGVKGLPSWSPDGTRLLFSRYQGGLWTNLGDAGTRLYLTDASGSAPQLVDTGCVSPCVSDSQGVFSSDGGRILFVRRKSIPVPASATPDPLGKPAQPTEVKVLASMDLATGRVTELGDFDRCDQCGSQWPRSDPSWSPDRTHIVFTQGIPITTPQSHYAAAFEVLIADADGRNVHQLSPSGGFPGWSPDGTRIVFQRERYSWVGNEERWFADIYTIRPDGTDLRRLTSDQISTNPAWSIDGRIWFIRTPMVGGNLQTAGPAQQWIMDADGGNATQSSLAPQPNELADTAWQPTP
jgi:dipeptidyl aminopeptidase/acylaminoacyl peptidase